MSRYINDLTSPVDPSSVPQASYGDENLVSHLFPVKRIFTDADWDQLSGQFNPLRESKAANAKKTHKNRH